jgi:tetratricopeptide (TPR) repeat protein
MTIRAYAQGLLEVGRYEDARKILEGPGGTASSLDLENTLGELDYLQGRLAEAEAAFRRALGGGAADRHVAQLNLGILAWDQGDREEALRIFDTFIDLYNRHQSQLSAEELMAVGIAVRYLGVTNSDLYHDALGAFDDAAAVDPADHRPDLLAGELFLEKYRPTDARESFRPVLETNPRHPRALLGQARILDFEGSGGSVELVLRALGVNPNYADAHAFLASLFLKTEDYDQAKRRAEEGLEINPMHLESLSVLAAAHFLEGDSAAFERTRSRVHALNPSYPDLYIRMAEAAVAQRQYQMAVDLAARAVELDPSSWRAYGVLGLNQLRTGAVEEGRENLERAWEGDPFNPWYMNTLDLLDTFVRYETRRTEHFEILLHEREAQLLGPYAESIAEKAFAALAARYGATPPTPIRLEIYPSHPDFSVRTVGLTGLGALGVSFGSTLVMDSPSAMDPGEFNWASTLWHEVAHAFHLAMTDHRVPRWFTEGLAVHEQHKAQPRWGYGVSPGWLQAYGAGRLHPVSQMNLGFIRPEYPEQVIFSYYQGSLVFEFIEEQWGLGAILAMLDGYRRGQSTEQVFMDALGQSPGAFDEAFDTFVRARWEDQMEAVAPPVDGEGVRVLPGEGAGLGGLQLWVQEEPGSFLARLALGRALFMEGRHEEAEPELQTALGLFPEYPGSDGPLTYLAQIYLESGEVERAARTLNRLGSLSEKLPEAHAQEADLWLELGEQQAATSALEKVVEILPFDLDAHEKLATQYEEAGNLSGAVRERRAVLALDPPDKAGAYYFLARALARAGDRNEARTQVLRALEIAPTFEPALDLLLELRREGGAEPAGETLELTTEGKAR